MSTDRKVAILIAIATGAILVGAIVFLSKDAANSVPPQDAITTTGLHWHPILTITIEGKEQEIPANIGILPTKHEELHTHEDNKEGIIHMEMQGLVTKDETRLGRFFQIWGKSFSSKGIFDKVNNEDGTLKMYVNGRENTKFENYEMKDKDKIEITFQ